MAADGASGCVCPRQERHGATVGLPAGRSGTRAPNQVRRRSNRAGQWRRLAATQCLPLRSPVRPRPRLGCAAAIGTGHPNCPAGDSGCGVVRAPHTVPTPANARAALAHNRATPPWPGATRAGPAISSAQPGQARRPALYRSASRSSFRRNRQPLATTSAALLPYKRRAHRRC